MSAARAYRRREERKFKRLQVRFGHRAPQHRAMAQQISTSGLFIVTNEHVFAVKSAIVVEVTGPAGVWVVAGVVRHAVRVHPTMARYSRPGMGIELVDPPADLRAFLASL